MTSVVGTEPSKGHEGDTCELGTTRLEYPLQGESPLALSNLFRYL